MKFDLKKPCSSCPFRADIDFFLRPGRREEIAQDLRSDKTFACHNTIDYDLWDEDGYRNTGLESHCAGALICLHKNGEIYDNYMYRLATLFFGFDPDKLDSDGPVFDSLDAFIQR